MDLYALGVILLQLILNKPTPEDIPNYKQFYNDYDNNSVFSLNLE